MNNVEKAQENLKEALGDLKAAMEAKNTASKNIKQNEEKLLDIKAALVEDRETLESADKLIKDAMQRIKKAKSLL